MLNSYTLKLIRQDGSFVIKQVELENHCTVRPFHNYTRQILRWLTYGDRRIISLSDCVEIFTEPTCKKIEDMLLASPSTNDDLYTVLHVLRRGVFKVNDKAIIVDSLKRYFAKVKLFQSEGVAVCTLCTDALKAIEEISNEFSYFIFEYSYENDEYASYSTVPLAICNIFDASLVLRDLKSVKISNASSADVEKLAHMIKNGELTGSLQVFDEWHDNNSIFNRSVTLKRTEQDPNSGVKTLMQRLKKHKQLELSDILSNPDIDFHITHNKVEYAPSDADALLLFYASAKVLGLLDTEEIEDK